MTFDELAARLAAWHKAKYGVEVTDDVERTALKLGEECGEVARHILRYDLPGAQEELADVLFVLFHLAAGMGVKLEEVAAKKLRVIEKRLKKRAGAKKQREGGGGDSAAI